MKTFPVLIFLALTASVFGQNARFPAAWVGKWTGQLEIHNGTGKIGEIPMELHIFPNDSLPGAYSWTIAYGPDIENGKRYYELQTVDAVRGTYLLDEKNSIKMEAYLLGDKLYQWFEVEKNMLANTTELVGDVLLWEIISGSNQPVSTTGGEVKEAEPVPLVKTFPVKTLQRARLKRV